MKLKTFSRKTIAIAVAAGMSLGGGGDGCCADGGGYSRV